LIVPHEVHHVPTPEPVEAPKVVVNQFAAPQIKMASATATPKLLHTGDFSGSSATPTVTAAVQKVQTGGFGDPNGLKGTGKEGAKLYAAQAGGFDMPVGPGQGNGSGGAKGIKGTVASADFGNGIATSNGRTGGGIATGGFGSEQVVHGGPKLAQADSGPATTPVEITFKPNPVYTDEARRRSSPGSDVQRERDTARESRGPRTRSRPRRSRDRRRQQNALQARTSYGAADRFDSRGSRDVSDGLLSGSRSKKVNATESVRDIGSNKRS
jgi:hypothetical protein